MPLTEIQRKIVTVVVGRFLNLNEMTPRKGLVISFQSPESIDFLISKNVLGTTDTRETVRPLPLAFHYCGDVTALSRAKVSAEIVLHSLKNLYQVEQDKSEFTEADVEAQARKIIPGPVKSENIRLGLYLIQQFGVLNGWGQNAQGEVTWIRVHEDIVKLNVGEAWDGYIQRHSVYVEGDPTGATSKKSASHSQGRLPNSGRPQIPRGTDWLSQNWEKVALFACAIVFLTLLIVLAIALPEPTPFQLTVFRVVLSLSAAGFAAFIPGFIHFEIKPTLRAGGALAVFAIVYFVNPAQLVKQGDAIKHGYSDRPQQTGTNEAVSEISKTDSELSPATKLPAKTDSHKTRSRTSDGVRSFVVEARMTCTIKDGEPLPPSTEEIIGGFGTGQIVGSAQTIELARTNPVEFRKQRNNEMIVVNHFYVPTSEPLLGEPISRLTNYQRLILPITVLGSGSLFDTIRLVEVTVTINNERTWYYPYQLGGVRFENGGPTVTIPLDGIKKVLN
jgi:hypothetical protein